ncbi:MAG: helix-turn-helix domain-containing protein [SAR86 cluster bacterium]|nr:helix-turn-helix domain-containing protein [SAR86 cluster bacterium]
MTLKSAHTGKIGKAFKNARTYRDLSLREVALKTLINIDYIKAIESGDYSIFPARIFAVQYFEKYSKFLGLQIPFFDIYNADVVAELEKQELAKNPKNFFLEKNLFSIFATCLFVILIFFVIFLINLTSTRVIDKPVKNIEQIMPLKKDPESNLLNKSEINSLHLEINNFFIKDALDSSGLSVNVDLAEPIL